METATRIGVTVNTPSSVIKDDTVIRTEYKRENAWGLLTSIDLHGCNPETIRDAKKVKRHVYELCERIGMKRFGECTVVNFGEDPRVSGFSMTQLIETSLISGHYANQSNAVYLDVFSCKYYNPYEVAEFTKEYFEAKNYNLHYTLRI